MLVKLFIAYSTFFVFVMLSVHLAFLLLYFSSNFAVLLFCVYVVLAQKNIFKNTYKSEKKGKEKDSNRNKLVTLTTSRELL